MAEEVGGIVYTVDMDTAALTKGADKVNVVLDDLNKGFDKVDGAAGGAEAAVTDVGDALNTTAGGAGKATDALNRTSTALSSGGKAAEEQADALRKLLGQIDPTVAATQRLDKLTQELGQAFDKGLISEKQYTDNLAKLDSLYATVDAKASGFTKRVQDEAEAFRQATAQNEKFNQALNKNSSASDGFLSKLTPLAIAVGGVISLSTLKQWGELAEQFTLLQNRINRLTPDLATAGTTYQALLATAASTGQTMPATVKLWETLTSSLKALGATNTQVITLTSELQKIGKIGGSSAEETSNALRQLGQSLNSGTLRAQEYNSIVEQTPELVRQLAAASGKSMGDFRQAMLDGKISAQDLFDLLLARTGAVDTEFKKLPRSVSDAANAITVEFGAALSVIDKATSASQSLAKILDGVAKGIQLTFNPTDVQKFNQLLQDRSDTEALYQRQQSSWFSVDKAATKTRLDGLNAEIKAMQDAQIAAQKKATAEANAPKVKPTTSPEGEKELKRLQDEAAALAVQGVERAQVLAVQKLGSAATEQEITKAKELAAQIYNQQQAEKAAAKAKQEGISAAKKAANEAAAAAKKDAAEEARNYDQNEKAIREMGNALTEAGLKGKELAEAQAFLKLNQYATPDQIAKVKELTDKLYALKQAQANKQLLGTVDPVAGADQSLEKQLKDIQTLQDAKVLSADRANQLIATAQKAHTKTMVDLQNETYKNASSGNALLFDGIDALGEAGTKAISGLLSGTSSLKDALGGVANTILNKVIGSFVEAGVEWVKQEIIKKAAVAATTTAQTTGIATVAGVQAGATAAIAATTTAKAATTGAAVSGSMAPAAGLSSIASFGSAAVIGGAALLATLLLAKSFGGGRQYGGAVDGSKMYRVNEGGAPEIFNAAGGKQYMMPNSRGEVVSNADATASGGGGGGGVTVNVNNTNGSGVRVAQRQSMDKQTILDVVVEDIASSGRVGRMVNSTTGTRRRGIK